MKRLLLLLLVLPLLAAGAVAAWLYQFAHAPLPLPETPYEFNVKPGASLKSLNRQLADAGLLPDAQTLWIVARFSGEPGGLQAGRYRLDKPLTPLQLLKKLNDGDVVTATITFVEGITFAEMRKLLEASKVLNVTLKGLPHAEVLKRVGATEAHPEGLFFPDTYRFAVGATDLEVLKRSYKAMQKRLAEAWAQKAAGLPYKTPYEALIMASIIEKETGRADERPLIGSVFTNRLKIPMRLQTDPTIIYGMGLSYDGNIRKKDITADTPYNTYTRDGLPPTPIAMPGWESLLAAVKPAESDKLYFVAKGDGSHYFSRSLDEHNRAVGKYQLGR